MPFMDRMDPFTSPTRSISARMESLFRDSSPDFDPGQFEINQTLKPIGDMTIAPVMPQTSYRERYMRMKQIDNERNALIEDLLRQVEGGQQQLQQLQFESKQNFGLQERADSLQNEVDSIRGILERNSYVTVLIDGDALTFPKELLSQGEKGGQEAVQLLTDAIRNFSSTIVPHLEDVTIYIKLFIGTKSIAELLAKTKQVDKSATFEHFLKGLMTGSPIFDIIDTGLFKGLKERKMRECYLHDFVNVHCHQIFLAALASTETNVLFDLVPDIPIHERITLLEARGLQPNDRFEHEVQSLSIDSLLCKIPGEELSRPPSVKVATPVLARVESHGSSKTFNSGIPSSTNTPVLTWAAMTAQPFLSRPGENKSNGSTPNLAKAHPATKSAPTVARNKFGQRVDSVDNSIPYQELTRIKKMKLCNIYYLQGKTACDGSCNHSHSYPLKAAERNILREVARMTPCHYKTECDDPSCIYGHRCPQSKPDKQDCYYKDDCRFTGWGHGIDEKVVKTHNIR